ncbi:MAG: DUF4184 family protein [Pseudomonadota bacterium]
MPFTLSHAAAALPLRSLLGRYASMSGLIIGSFSPDLPYFMNIGIGAKRTHSVFGALTYSLIIGFVAYLVFHFLVRPAFLPALPAPLRERIPRTALKAGLPQVPIAAVILSLALGALTHVAWDSFTHARAVDLWEPMFAIPVLVVGGHEFFLYKVLQYASGVIGLLIIAAYLKYWLATTPRREDAVDGYSLRVQLGIALCLLLIPAFFGVLTAAETAGGHGVAWLVSFLPATAFAAGAAFVPGVVAISGILLLIRAS